MKKLYRYEIEYSNSDDPDTRVVLRELEVKRETEHTYFINNPYQPHKEKRVSKTARKTYAFIDKDKAKKHFINRTETRISWNKYWVRECEKGLEIINKKP